MTWVGIGGSVAGAVVGGVMNGGGSSTNGGAGTQTQSKEPWAAAQPWILNNLVQGQALQNQYLQSPFNPQQQAAYGRMGNQTAYMGALTPSLLGQLSSQQVGFDRSNPNYRPPAFNFDGNTGMGSGVPAGGSLLQSGSQPQSGGLLGMLTSNNNTAQNASLTPVKPPAPAPAPDFVQQGYGDPLIEQQMKQFGTLGGNQLYIDPSNYTGKFGTFKYGDAMPQAGTQAYKDMNDYFAYGGADPMNLYGKAPAGLRPNRDGGGGIGDTGANAAASASGNGAW